MATVLERLREALAPEYEVQREIARGGMGMVFLAREVTLDRQVAIKIIRPELATARAAEKFISEARILANLRHPNVIAVHRAERTGGFFYYVMDYIEGETLADRLAGGPLTPHEALKLGRDLLDALDAVHGMGVVHRDIKPSNILIVGGRAILTDFGIAKPSQEPAGATDSRGRVVGTIGYMPPEQAYGWKVTARTDLFAVGVVIYEAYTGRRWGDQMPDKRPDWSGIPRKVVPVLRRALIWEPQERWPDATSFRHKLWKTRTHRYRRRTLLLTIGGLVAGAVVAWLLTPGEEPLPPADVALLPFVAGDGIDPDLAHHFRLLTEVNLRSFGASVVAEHRTDAIWNEPPRSLESIGQQTAREFGANHLVHAVVALDSADTTIALTVWDGGAARDAGIERLHGDRSRDEIGHRLGHRVLAFVAPNRQSQYRGPVLSDVDEAVVAYVDGIEAFKQNDFAAAVSNFRQAMALDATFGRAAWRYDNAWRWLLTGEPSPVDLAELLATHGDDLPEIDSLLITAQLAPTLSLRLQAYAETVRLYPRDAYALFLYADEMQTRGAMIGIPLDSATRQLERAANMDSTFGPIQLGLIHSYVRQGQQERTLEALNRYQRIYVETDDIPPTHPMFLGLLMEARFSLPGIDEELEGLLGQPGIADFMRNGHRIVAQFDLAPFQLKLAAEFLAKGTTLEPAVRAHLHEGRGLALIGLGRLAEGMRHIDSAAALWDTDQARLEAAEWRVVASALGLPVDPEEIERGRARLLDLQLDPAARPRATWALGVAAAARQDTSATRQWLDSLLALPTDTVAQRLAVSLNAIYQGSREQYETAVRVSQESLQYDSAGRGGDPFARAVLHLSRAEWYDRLGERDAADRERLWYEHFDLLGFPAGVAQPGEIDWALSAYARLLRARAASQMGDRDKACTHYVRLTELWAAADPEHAPYRNEAAEYVRRSCR